jgi:uncharacterized iron-regulated membrane protein
VKNRDWFRIHSWLGVFSGLLLFVLCWSGTVATVSHEIDWLLNPALRAEASGARADWGQIHDSVRREFPDASIEWMHAPRHAGFASEVVVLTPDKQRLRVYVHPGTAEVQGSSTYFNVQRFFRSFHMILYLPYPAGAYLVGVFGLMLVASTLAPLFFYKRWWTRFTELRVGHGQRALWSGLHKLGGLWSLWFGLLIGLTGIWYLVEQATVDAGATFAYPPMPERVVPAEAPRLGVNVLASAAEQLRPDLDISRVLFVRGQKSEGMLFCGDEGNVLVRPCADRVYLDPVDASAIQNQSASDLDALSRWVDTADPLHFGDFGGLISQFIWFVFGLLLTGLCLTGIYLHLARLARERHARRTHWPGTTAAIAVSLLVLIASIHGGWHDIRQFGPSIEGGHAWPQVAPAVVAFIAGWILVTLTILWVWVRNVAQACRRAVAVSSESCLEVP